MPPELPKFTKKTVNLFRTVVQQYKQSHRYETAGYWADKLAYMTGEEKDFMECAQCHYLNGQYHRASSLVNEKINLKTCVEGVQLIGNCHLACKSYDEAIKICLSCLDPDGEIVKKMSEKRFLDWAIEEGYYKNDRFTKGEFNKQSGLRTRQMLKSSLWLIAAKSYEAQMNYEMSKMSYEQALIYDPFCWEAYDKIITNRQLCPDLKEKDLLNIVVGIGDYDHCRDNSAPNSKLIEPGEIHAIQNFLYTLQLSTMKEPEYGLKSVSDSFEKNPDVMVFIAEKHYYECDYSSAHKITRKVLEKDPFHVKCLPIHIALLVETKEKHDLFILAHRLVDNYPKSAISWFGVACYYYVVGNHDVARQYFTKTTTLDPSFGAAWLAFGHSFAADNEHDQAMAAYFKASQVMTRCHLPFWYIALEYGVTSNYELASQFFNQALLISDCDPFLIHDLSVVDRYHSGNYEAAYKTMLEAFSKYNLISSDSSDRDMSDRTSLFLADRWEAIFNNMGHCCRKLGNYKEAIEFHEKALVISPREASSYSAIGYTYMLMEKFEEAVQYFHKSLVIRQNDATTVNMLNIAVTELTRVTSELFLAEEKDSMKSNEKSSRNMVKLQNLAERGETSLTTQFLQPKLAVGENSQKDEISAAGAESEMSIEMEEVSI